MSAQRGRYPSPLRYPGGKGKLANFLKLTFLENEILGGEYAEPYAGGASVALSLLFEEYSSNIYINDINAGVYAFWRAVLDHTDSLCRLIADTELTVDEWVRQKHVQSRGAEEGAVALGFSTFVLNRTNRSGIVGGGVIGGVNQTGPWKLDARYNRPELIRRILKVAKFRDRITVSNLDALEFLIHWSGGERFGLVYLDPPYYCKGDSLYENFYEHRHHVDVAVAVRQMKPLWLVSYDASQAIVDLYAGLPSCHYTLSYSARQRYRGSEVMFFSPELRVPAVGSPGGISFDDVVRRRQRAFATTGDDTA